METGDVLQWIARVPWIILRSSENEKIIHGVQKMIYLGEPVFIRASYEVDSAVTDSTMDCWVLEWTEGHRQCRIRSILSETGYWRLVKTRKKKKSKENKQTHEMLFEEFPEKDNEGPFIKIEDNIIRPAIFYVAILKHNIALQHVRTKLWVSIRTDNGALTGVERFEDSCSIDVGIKAAISSKYKHKRYFLHTPLLSKYITQDSWWIRRKQTFFLIFKGTHLVVYSAGTEKYWNIDKKNRLETSEVPAKVQLKNGEPFWEIFVDISTDESNPRYVQLLQAPDKTVVLKSEIKPEEMELVLEKSKFEISLLPSSKGKDLKLSQSRVNVEEQKELFGTSLDEFPKEMCRDDGVPLFLLESIEFISAHITSEGLFRISGRSDRILELRMMLNSGLTLEQATQEMNSREGTMINVDDIGGLLKIFFRDLPRRLIPDSVVQSLIEEPADKTTESVECGGETVLCYRETLLNVKSVVNRRLTKQTRAILQTLCEFLHEVAAHCKENKMTPYNLAIVIAPNLIPGDDSPANWVEVVSIMIAFYPFVFSGPNRFSRQSTPYSVQLHRTSQ